MRKIIFLALVISISILPYLYIVEAQSSAKNVEKQKVELERELREVEKQIQAQQQIVNEAKRQTSSIERDITILDAQIREAELKIQAKNIAIAAGAKGEEIETIATQMASEKNISTKRAEEMLKGMKKK